MPRTPGASQRCCSPVRSTDLPSALVLAHLRSCPRVYLGRTVFPLPLCLNLVLNLVPHACLLAEYFSATHLISVWESGSVHKRLAKYIKAATKFG
jgi:hypothetical protein